MFSSCDYCPCWYFLGDEVIILILFSCIVFLYVDISKTFSHRLYILGFLPLFIFFNGLLLYRNIISPHLRITWGNFLFCILEPGFSHVGSINFVSDINIEWKKSPTNVLFVEYYRYFLRKMSLGKFICGDFSPFYFCKRLNLNQL